MSGSILEVDIKEYLASVPAIAAIVPPAQFYGAFIRSDASFPALSITTVGRTAERTLGSNLTTMKRVQIDCFTMTYLTCKTLEQAVETALDGFTGMLQSGSTIRIVSCYSSTVIDNWDNDSSVFRTMLTFEIEHTAVA